MPLLDALVDYIEANVAGLTEGTNLFKSLLPPTPDAAVALYEYPGAPGTYTYGGTGASPERPKVQIVARATTYSSARSTLESIYTFLDGKTGLTLSGVSYLGIFAIQAPFAVERDSNNRELVACNFEVIKTPG